MVFRAMPYIHPDTSHNRLLNQSIQESAAGLNMTLGQGPAITEAIAKDGLIVMSPA